MKEHTFATDMHQTDSSTQLAQDLERALKPLFNGMNFSEREECITAALDHTDRFIRKFGVDSPLCNEAHYIDMKLLEMMRADVNLKPLLDEISKTISYLKRRGDKQASNAETPSVEGE